MRIFDWLKKLGGGGTANADEPGELVFDAGKEELGGLNFKTAIDAHMKWKLRLSAVIDGTSTETLDPDVIGRDDQCVLGKWIHGEGGRRYEDSMLFEKLRDDHATFHRCAANVLREALTGDKEQARVMLTTGDYSRASMHVTSALAKLYARYMS
ncbi:CZB domain-containing protein [Ferriphaselus sp. R-1]|uniref:CZB domain-containing protein n=1 Tax=Ferriphaselus sp. R-1 TaxID=1485544 RepID=UPI000557391A|nr:CZB domain-containing protein [Ferriphaselus sp. R-1]